jgi:hypothetical protein
MPFGLILSVTFVSTWVIVGSLGDSQITLVSLLLFSPLGNLVTHPKVRDVLDAGVDLG